MAIEGFKQHWSNGKSLILGGNKILIYKKYSIKYKLGSCKKICKLTIIQILKELHGCQGKVALFSHLR